MRRPPSRLADRARLALLTLAVSFSVAACEDPLPPIPPPHPKHDLVIEGGMFRYNGTPLGPGVPSQVWLDQFGPPERVGVSAWFWDSLGLAVGATKGPPTPESISSCVTVVFEVLPWRISAGDQITELEPTGFPTRLTKAFPGRILLGGAPLFKGAQAVHVNQSRQFECRSARGAGFQGDVGFSANPAGSKHCSTEKPLRDYSLETYLEKRKVYAAELKVCCDLYKPCG